MTNWKLILTISKTNLLSRFKQSVVAALGVTMGIGAFIILMSFMTGLNGILDGLILNRTPHVRLYNDIKPSEEQPINQVNDKGCFNVIHSIKPKKSLLRVHNSLAIIKYLKNHDKVMGVCPQVAAQVFYVAGSIRLNGMINGIDANEESRLFNFSDYIIEGDIQNFNNTNDALLIGVGVSKKLSLGIGDRVQVTSTTGNIMSLKIVGIYQSGMADYDNVQSFTNIKTAQKIMGVGSNYITDINLKLNNIEEAPSMAIQLAKQFNISAIDIKAANAQFDTGSSIRNLITYAVSITLLLVAGFGIYNILNMMIFEKMNDIAILKATGFSGNDVKNVFIMQAMLIGLVGGALGLLVGYGVVVLIDNAPFETEALPTITTYPITYEATYYVIGIIFALIATFFAGYLPAIKAKKIDPVEIIRGQ